jgi:2-polyprenyl-3-methyl-5-hydroxy-6-metoxy-1,4-benzoquinol methylase
MSEVLHAVPAERSGLRHEVITRYLSSSAGIHRSCAASERRAFVDAYRWHLKEWLPADCTLPWLDLGCGQGQLMSLAHASGFGNVSGVDLSAEMLSACHDAGLNVHQADAVEYVRNVQPDEFGIVSAFDFVEHLKREEALALLRAARRALQPGGVMLIKVPNGASPRVGDIFFSDLTHESMWTPASIAQLASLAGFSQCQVKEVGPVPHGARSNVRYVLWRMVRAWHRLLNAIETGSPGPNVLTRVMLVRLS